MTMRSNFERGRITQCEVLLDVGEPGEVAARGNELGGTPQLVDRAIDRHRADAVLQFGDVGVDVLERHMRCSLVV